jgi:hypothetical protein
MILRPAPSGESERARLSVRLRGEHRMETRPFGSTIPSNVEGLWMTVSS